MPRLPAVLEPAFPALKRAHLAATRSSGAVGRRLAPWTGERAVPQRGTATARSTADAEPDAAVLHPCTTTPATPWRPPEEPGAAAWFFDDVATLRHAERFTLELGKGAVAGLQGAVVTAGGTLDFETSPYFGARQWTEHPVFVGPRLPDVVDVPGSVLALATRGTAGNYYHFLFDALPRWKTFLDSTGGAPVDTLLVSASTRYERELLGLLGLDDHRILEPSAAVTVRGERLWVPSIPTYEDLVPAWAVDWLRTQLPPRSDRDLPKRLYVTRGTRPNSRRLLCEPQLVVELRRRGFEVIDPGSLAVQDQIDHFAAAEIIVSPHGAALTNLAFASPGVKVLELFAPKYLNPGYWSVMSSIPDASYRYLVGDGGGPTGNRKKMMSVYADIDLPMIQILNEVEVMMS